MEAQERGGRAVGGDPFPVVTGQAALNRHVGEGGAVVGRVGHGYRAEVQAGDIERVVAAHTRRARPGRVDVAARGAEAGDGIGLARVLDRAGLRGRAADLAETAPRVAAATESAFGADEDVVGGRHVGRRLAVLVGPAAGRPHGRRGDLAEGEGPGGCRGDRSDRLMGPRRTDSEYECCHRKRQCGRHRSPSR